MAIIRVGAALGFLLLAAGSTICAAEAPQDVPTAHWAKRDVEAVLQRGVMTAPGGKFNGAARVSRTQLIQTMAAFGRSLEKGAWQARAGKPSKGQPARPATAISQPVTRYELAAIVARMGAFAAGGVPKPGAKRFGESTAIPRAPSITSVKKTDPAYDSVQYLAKNRMIWPNSVLAKPGPQPVTGKEVADAVVAVITGVIDQHTDEPQNREEIGPPPSRGGGRG